MLDCKNTFSLLFYVNRAKLNKNGEVPLFLRITIRSKRTNVNLLRYVDPNAWHPGTGRVYGRTSQVKAINDYIEAINHKARIKYNELVNIHDNVTPEMLRDAILGIPSQGTLIMQVWRNFNEDQQKLIGIETSRACCRKYEQSMSLLHDFIKEKTGQDDMSVKKIDPSFIDQYSLYLKADCKYAHNTANKHLQRFKRIVLLALRNGVSVRATPSCLLRSLGRILPRIKTILNDTAIKITSYEAIGGRISSIRT